MEQKKTFEPFERVVWRTTFGDGKEHLPWECGFYSHYNEEDKVHVLVGQFCVYDEDVLPFEGNSHLVGTREIPCEEVEISKGELCAMFGDEDDIRNCRADIRGFSYAASFSVFDTSGGEYGYCVKLSQFNTNDMEETKKHILCVRNGKLVGARV